MHRKFSWHICDCESSIIRLVSHLGKALFLAVKKHFESFQLLCVLSKSSCHRRFFESRISVCRLLTQLLDEFRALWLWWRVVNSFKSSSDRFRLRPCGCQEVLIVFQNISNLSGLAPYLISFCGIDTVPFFPIRRALSLVLIIQNTLLLRDVHAFNLVQPVVNLLQPLSCF